MRRHDDDRIAEEKGLLTKTVSIRFAPRRNDATLLILPCPIRFDAWSPSGRA